MQEFDVVIKNLNNFEFSSREVIEIQSRYYYNLHESKDFLGFETLVEQEESYSVQIFNLIRDLAYFMKKNKSLSILELGAGTGRFYKNISKLLEESGIKFTYTIVDVAKEKFRKDLKGEKNLKIINRTFNEFTKKNKENFDFLILNEALDMWAGEEKLIDKWEDNLLPFKPFWVVVDNYGDFVQRDDVKKIKINNFNTYSWNLLFFDEINNKIINKEYVPDHRYKIMIPTLFKKLMNKIKYLTVIHDYWSFYDEDNNLRSQQREKTSQIKAKITWNFANKIPFGSVDITYSPDQSELMDYIMQTNLQLSNLSFINKNKFDDSIYYVGKENSEIFLLYTEEAVKLQYNKINL